MCSCAWLLGSNSSVYLSDTDKMHSMHIYMHKVPHTTSVTWYCSAQHNHEKQDIKWAPPPVQISKVRNKRKQEACERLTLVPLRWNMGVFALAALTKNSAIRGKKERLAAKASSFSPFPHKPLLHSLFLQHHKHFISLPSQETCLLNQGNLLLIFSHSWPNRIISKRWDVYEHNSNGMWP